MEIGKKDVAILEQLREQSKGMTCETCKFYTPIQSIACGEEPTWEKFGKCHRNPPHNKNNSIAARAYFPTVASDDWCGEHIERGA